MAEEVKAEHVSTNTSENSQQNVIMKEDDANLSCEEVDSDDLDGDMNLSDDDSGNKREAVK